MRKLALLGVVAVAGIIAASTLPAQDGAKPRPSCVVAADGLHVAL